MWRKKDNAKVSMPHGLAFGAIATIVAGLSMAVAEDFDRDGLEDAWEAVHGFCTNAVAATNLVGWWQMDEAAGSNVWDRSGNAIHGAMAEFGVAPFVTGLFSNALVFGSNAVVAFPADGRLGITNGFTISAWYAASNVTERATLARWTDVPSNAWELAVGANGVARLEFRDGNGAVQTVAGTTNAANLHDGQWHHVAGTYVASNCLAAVYADGLAEASSVIGGWVPSPVSSFTLGSSSPILPPSSFLLDEVRLYNRALSADEVPQLPPTFDDPDGDGLSNLEEYRQGTDPHRPDTDGDGRLDGVDAHPADYYDGILPELMIVSGNQQTGATNAFLAQPLVVRVTAGGVPLNNAPVTLAVKQGGGQLSVSTNGTPRAGSLPLRTAGNGEVSVWWRLAGGISFTNRVEAAAVSGAQEQKVVFSAQTAGDGRTLKRLIAGGTHSMVLGPDGQVWAWGDNSCGQLNDGSYSDGLVPVRCVGGANGVAVSGGLLQSLMLRSDGTVWGWGYNGLGQLGNGRTSGAEMSPVAASGMSDVVAVEAGSYHTVMLRSDGTVWTCGRNAQGELGDGTTTGRLTPVLVSGLDQVVAIGASSGSHAAALRADGTVWCWGWNGSGQLGDGTTTDRNTPVRVNNLESVVAIATGGNYTLALRSDGTLWAWGANDGAQLGNGTRENQLQPVRVGNLSNVVAIAAGNSHGLALKADGTVWAWGCGANGRLGDGAGLNREFPVQVPGLGNVTAIAAGMGHSLAMTADGNVWAWGENYDGELGDGTRTNRLAPVLAQLDLDQDGLPDPWERQYFLGLGYGAMDDPDGDGFANGPEFLAGSHPAMADSDGDGLPDGIDAFPCDFLNGVLPQLRVVSGHDQAADPGSFLPQPLVVEVMADGAAVPNLPVTFSVRQGGSRLSSSTVGVLASTLQATTDGNGRASAFVRLGPVAAFSNRISARVGVGANAVEVMLTPSTTKGTRLLRRAAGGGFHSILLADDATMWGWGMNSFGQLGDGTYQDRPSPVRASVLSEGVSVAAGWGHSLFLKADGAVWGCGYNGFGQLGNMWSSSTANVARPIAGLDDLVAVAAGAFHSVALRSDGAVWVVGRNYEGELGNGTTSPGWIPSPVGGLGPVQGVSAGSYHTVAVLCDGTVWAWGANWSGQLGDGTTTTRTVPVPVVGLNNVTAVSAGEYHTLALKSDGTVWAWGQNGRGQLGDGTDTQRNAPVPVAGLTNVVEIAAGGYHSMARKADGSVWVWGGNWVGQLGLGHTTTQYAPVQLAPAGSADAIAAGEFHTLVRKADGAILAAGYNSNGQIGDGTTVQRNAPVETPLDTDYDGLPDSWERRYFLDLSQNGGGDFDGDGLANLLEFQFGADPTDFYNGVLPQLSVVSGDHQNGPPDSLLPQPLVVQVMGAQMNGTNTVPLAPLSGAPLTFTVADGEAQLGVSNGAPLSTSLNLRTGSDGLASVMCRLSSALGVTNRIAVTATSGSSSNSVYFTASAADATPPLVAIVSPENGQWTTNAAVEVSGIAQDNQQLASVDTILNGVLTTNLTCAATNQFEFAVTVNSLVTGSNALQVVARDLAGNTNSHAMAVFRASDSSDVDGDGLRDVDELHVYGTDPVRADTDADGIPDAWEISHGLNPFYFADAALDYAGNGTSNLQKFQQNQDPYDYYGGVAPILSVVSGDDQTGHTNSFLPQPLLVRVSREGLPLSSAPITFVVAKGEGLLATDTNGAPLDIQQTVRTDADGYASVLCRLASVIETNRVDALAITGATTNSAPFHMVALDEEDPVINLMAPTNGQWATTNCFTVVGSASDNQAIANLAVYLNGASAGSLATNASLLDFSFPVSGLVMGTNTVRVVATDPAGRTQAVERPLVRYAPDGDQDGFSDAEETLMNAAAAGLTTVDHGGSNWVLTASQNVSGRHVNIGLFMVTNDVTATVPPSVGKLWVEAQIIDVRGTISANGAGLSGATSGGAGGARGSIVGGGGTAATAGASGSAASGPTGGAGGGGGAKGTIVARDRPNITSGGAGGAGQAGGYNTIGVNTDTTTNYTLSVGGGGGAGGGGGGAETYENTLGATYERAPAGAGGRGGAGGAGGGAVWLFAANTNAVAGAIRTAGTGGGSNAGSSVHYIADRPPYPVVGQGGSGGTGGTGCGGGILLWGRSVNVTGTLDASGGPGGTVKLLGPSVNTASATINRGRLYLGSVTPAPPPPSDRDGDGLDDQEEQTIYQTSPVAFDTDGDGMGDGFEAASGNLNPAVANDPNADPDGDGLTNIQEQLYGAKPGQADSDGDGIHDGAEVAAGSHPGDPADTPTNQNYLPVKVGIGDADLLDDVWNIYLENGKGKQLVVTNQSNARTIQYGTAYIRKGTKATFTMTRPPLNQGPGTDEYQLSFLRLDSDPDVAWVADAGNSGLSGALPYVGGNPPDPSGLQWVFTAEQKPKIEIAVDANRDGTIEFGDQSPDKTDSAHPFRFFLNDDQDGWHQTHKDGLTTVWEQDDLKPGNPNCDDDIISCRRDLEDFQRLWIKVDMDLQSTDEVVLKWDVTEGAPAIKIYPAAESDGGKGYLTDVTVKQIYYDGHDNYASAYFGKSIATVSGTAEVAIPLPNGSTWKKNTARYYLFEVSGKGKGTLKAAIRRGSQSFGESKIYCDFKNIKEMYERWTMGDATESGVRGAPDPKATADRIADYLPNPLPAPTTDEEKDFVLFVHGWNMETWEKDRYAETAFKRLYWQGYKGRFGSFRWPTSFTSLGWEQNIPWVGTTSNGGPVWDHQNFDKSEFNSWKSAEGLRNLLAQLKTTYQDSGGNSRVRVLAHSHGNIATAEALHKASSQLVHTYVATQAALAAHCLDGNETFDVSNTWGQHFYEVFATLSTPNVYKYYPGEAGLDWQQQFPTAGNLYMGDMGNNGKGGAGKWVNFFNPVDYALDGWVTDQAYKPDIGYAYDQVSELHGDPPHPVNAWRFYRNVPQKELSIPEYTYEVFSYCAQARSSPVGMQSGMAGPFTGENNWNQFGVYHPGHSAQFRSTNAERSGYWETLLGRDGFDISH